MIGTFLKFEKNWKISRIISNLWLYFRSCQKTLYVYIPLKDMHFQEVDRENIGHCKDVVA